MTDSEYQQLLIDLMFNPPTASGTDYSQVVRARAILARQQAEQAEQARRQAEQAEQARQQMESGILEATHGLAALAAMRAR